MRRTAKEENNKSEFTVAVAESAATAEESVAAYAALPEVSVSSEVRAEIDAIRGQDSTKWIKSWKNLLLRLRR